MPAPVNSARISELREWLMQDNTSVGDLVRAITMPKEFGKGFRLASEGAGMPSATALLPCEFKTSSWANATVDSELPAAELQGFLFSNALRAFVYFDHNPSGLAYLYNLQNVSGTGASFPLASFGQSEIIPRFATVDGTSAWRPHGPTLFPGFDEAGHYYTWADKSSLSGTSNVTVTLNAGPVGVGGCINLWVFNGKTGVLVESQQYVAAQTAYVLTGIPTGGAYFYITVYNAEAGVSSCTVSVTNDGPTWCHQPVTNISSIINVAQGIRVNSASVRWQNNASLDYQNGSITSATVPKGTPWQNVAGGTDFISALQGYVTRESKEGLYCFNVMDDDDDVSTYYNDIALDASPGGQVYQTAYPLDERRPYKTFAANIPIANGRSTLFEVTHAIEYLTNVKTMEQGFANYSAEHVAAAVMIVRSMASDYGNPVHIREILNTIGRYLPAAWAAAKDILSLIPDARLSSASSYFSANENTAKRLGDTLAGIGSKRGKY